MWNRMAPISEDKEEDQIEHSLTTTALTTIPAEIHNPELVQAIRPNLADPGCNNTKQCDRTDRPYRCEANV
ncbi:hypothetical protein NECAME_15725 [Necator americanus]|uniref:Uncharacterized protein n=1 Tax=Necator americanus TaxID=51031 RepID=W2SG85_NECAM|nr:hypothetical protein NECAME_15725 [Necator americanus]ETN68615.1 hypothetical protein NECAME_15725 [Necator americanus]